MRRAILRSSMPCLADLATRALAIAACAAAIAVWASTLAACGASGADPTATWVFDADADAVLDLPGDATGQADDAALPLDASAQADADDDSASTPDAPLDPDSDAVADALADGTDADPQDAAGGSDVVDAADAGSDAVDAAPDGLDTDATDADAAPDTVEPPPVIWDQALVADASTAGCTFSNKRQVFEGLTPMDLWDVSYLSWESIDGKLQPILIRGYAARPVLAPAVLPGVVQAHGLGGYAKADNATGPAALLGMFVLAYTGPGGGSEPANTSQGLPAMHQDGYRLFDVLKDVRGSWFWGHATAARRALTCLQTRPDVDASKLGITGFSAGGVVSLLLAGADARVKAAVPMSGTLAWSRSVESPTAWQHGLLKAAGLSVSSPEWLILQQKLIEPTVALAQAKARVLMLDGTTDEFFPLTAFAATFQALPGGDHRVSLAANFDHGCYSLTGVEGKAAIEDRARLRSEGGQRLWFHHWFGTDGDFAYVPQPPAVQLSPTMGGTVAMILPDNLGPKLAVETVELWWSQDSAYVFAKVPLQVANGFWTGAVPAAFGPTSVWYVDVQYKTKGLIPKRFSISSLPAIGPGLVPHIRAMDTCL